MAKIKLTKEQKAAYRTQVRVWMDMVDRLDLLPMVMITLGPNDGYKLLVPKGCTKDALFMVLKAALATAEHPSMTFEEIIHPTN